VRCDGRLVRAAGGKDATAHLQTERVDAVT
jgi:hypothetical protein